MKNRNLSGGLFAASKPTPLTIKETPLSAQIAAFRALSKPRLAAIYGASASSAALTGVDAAS